MRKIWQGTSILGDEVRTLYNGSNSSIEIKQYSETSMAERFKKHFEKVECRTVDHTTPSDTVQNFVFCSFRKS